MQTALYAVAMHTTIMELVTSIVSDGIGGVLTVLAVILAWLLIGSGIAWTIGNASDLGETPEK